MHRITVVEDDHILQESVKKILESQGFAVRVCPDGRSALSEIPADKPDLILLDVNLPDMTGHDICRALKADPRTAGVPVIILTGEARDSASQVAGLEAGAEDYIFKPVDWRVLASRVKSILAAVSRGKA
jgi:DNA-binding response OmpR family regulator